MLDSKEGSLGLLELIDLSREKPWEQTIHLLCAPLHSHHCDYVRNKIHGHISTRNQSIQGYIAGHQRSVLHKIGHGIQLQLQAKPLEAETTWLWKGTLGDIQHTKLTLYQDKDRNSFDLVVKRAKQDLSVLKQLASLESSSITQLLCYHIAIYPVFLLKDTLKDAEALGKYFIKRQQMYQTKSPRWMVEEIVFPCLDAVEFCHSRDIVLRDITADSYMIAKCNEINTLIKLEIPSLARDLTALSGDSYIGKFHISMLNLIFVVILY